MRQVWVCVGFVLAASLTISSQVLIRRPAAVVAAPASTPCTDAANLSNAIYVRQGASGAGTGANWTDALTAMPSTLTRGKTYCVADTTTGFGAWTVSSHPASGTTYTYVVKATIADHGTSSGWTDTFGDGQAVWSSSAEDTFEYTASSGYLEINGNGSTTTCGSTASLAAGSATVSTQMATQTGCGFKFINTSNSNENIQWRANGDHSVMRYVEVQGPTGTSTGDTNVPDPNQAMGIAAWGGGFSNGLVSYCYVHNNVTQIDTLGNDAIIEHTFIANSRNSNLGANHDNVYYLGGGTDGITFRYNHAVNFDNEGIIITWFSSGNSQDIFIYGNVFYSPSGLNSRGIEIRQNDSGSPLTNTNLQMYNNTFAEMTLVGIYDRTNEVNAANTSCVSCLAQNNLSVNAPNDFTNGETTQVSNTSDSTTSRFVGYGFNFHLNTSLAGTGGLSSPYNTDLLGNTRGADGTWDRGAYEFCSGGCTFAWNRPMDSVLALLLAPWRSAQI